MTFNLSGQSNDNVSKLTSKEKDKLIELVKSLFEKGPNIQFNIASNDLKSTFSDMSEEKKYDKTYLNNLLEILNKDPLNPVALYSVGYYYSNTNNQLLAKSYYQKSYDNLKLKLFEKDSAAYYSFRANLKNNLGVPNALDDLERSIEINPNDSLSMNIYPMVLISEKKFQKASEVILSALETNPKDATGLYLNLFMTEFYGSIPYKIEKENGIKNYNKKYSVKNYDEIVDFTLLDKYANKYRDNIEIVNCRMMIDILVLFFKMGLFEPTEDHKVNFNFNTYELNKMEDIINKLSNASSQKSMNEFSINRCLGYIYFMREEWDKSLEHFNKAIEIAPLDKEGIGSNSNACYDAIMTIYKHTSDTLNYRQTISRKMEHEPNIENTVDDLILLAFDDYRSGRIDEAKAYCDKAILIDSNNFDALRLMSHISFLKRDYIQSQIFMQKASNNFRNINDAYNLNTQYAIYLIHHGDLEKAKSNLENVKQIRGENNCPLCDKLIEEYCNVKPK